jgi:hypothetical protein
MTIQWLNIMLYLNDTKIPYQERQYQQKRKQEYGGHVPFMDIKKRKIYMSMAPKQPLRQLIF